MKDKVQDVKKFGRRFLLCRREWLDEINSRCGLRSGLAEKRRERLHLVASLHLLHIVDVTRVEELRAISWERQFGLRAKNLINARRRLAFPVRACKQEGPASIAGRARSDVGEVLRVVVDELDGKITIRLHGRHRKHEWLATQVRANHGVKRVCVGSLDRLVCGREQPCAIPDLVPWPLVLPVCAVHEVGVLDPVIIDNGETVDVGVPRDRAGFCRRDACLGARGSEPQSY